MTWRIQEPDSQLTELRSLLLAPDRKENDELRTRVETLQTILDEEPLLAERLMPHMDQHTEHLQKNFSGIFGKQLSTAISEQISNPETRKELIHALSPIIGRLIVQYLRDEIERISQLIDQRLQNPFESIKIRIKAFFSGVTYEEMLLRETVQPSVKEVFIIQKETGLPLAHYSPAQVSHPEVVAGMLTGIKAFVEHAFDTNSQELQTLEYEKDKILLHNFEEYYFAVVVEGPPHAEFRKQLRDKINRFCETHPFQAGGDVYAESQQQLSAQLTSYFHGFGTDHQ